MAKNNIRSIRFSDELAELIDRQVGNNFTEKFENLITRCIWELPQKEKELEFLNKEIQAKREKLKEANLQYGKMVSQLDRMKSQMRLLELNVQNAINEWHKS